MDGLTAFVEVLKAVAWPVVVTVLVVSQRKSLATLIAGLKPKSAKGFGAEIDFEPKIDRVEDKIEAAKVELTSAPMVELQFGTPASEVATTAARLHEVQRQWELALASVYQGKFDVLPTERQIEQTWGRIERLLEDLLNEDDALPPLHTSPSIKRMLTMARHFDVIPESVAEAINELYGLRSKVVHTGYEALSSSEAERFADSARTVEAILEFFLKAAKERNADRQKGA